MRLLKALCCNKFDANNYEDQVSRISKQRHYSWSDVVTVSPETMENFEQKTEMFSTEHFHGDEEVRFVLEGKGFFEVRDRDDNWIRIQVEKGDFLILPPGINHRFFFPENEEASSILTSRETLSHVILLIKQQKRIKFMRLFLDKSPYRINFRESHQSIELSV